MALKDLLIGSHVGFAREGETIDGGVVSKNVRPDNDPTTNYTSLGCVEQYEPSFNQEFISRRCPVEGGGRYRTRVRIPISQELIHNLALQEWDEFTFAELLLGGSKPDAQGDFSPGARTDTVRGWFRLANLDQKDQLINEMYIWGEAEIASYQFGESIEPYTLQITQLGNPLNTGSVDFS